MTPLPPADLIAVTLAARLLGVRAAVIRDRIKKGYMHAQRSANGRLFLSRLEFEHWRPVGKLPARQLTQRPRHPASPARTVATPPNLLTVQRAAALLGVSRTAIYGRIDRGSMIAIRTDAGRLVIPPAEVDRWQRSTERARPPLVRAKE